MKKTLLAIGLLSAQTFAAPITLKFKEVKAIQDVFSVTQPGEATAINGYMAFNEWRTSQTGRFFSMEVAPVLSGKLAGGVQLPAPKDIDPSKYKGQGSEFAKLLNSRNEKGRRSLADDPKTPTAKRLKNEFNNTYVVQSVLATVLPRPFDSIKLNPENFAEAIENADVDHFHFRIPGSFVLEALENDHIAAKSVRPDSAYLLSVIDFREYKCKAMQVGLRSYFASEDSSRPLTNDSIYLISDLTMNNPADLSAAEKFFGKKPNAVLSQQILYADRLMRGARTVFVFFAEGAQTRVVLVSNLGLPSKHFVGLKALPRRQIIMDGFDTLSGRTVKSMSEYMPGSKETNDPKSKESDASDLLSRANKDVADKNACNLGLAKGLIRYSRDLFGEFLGSLR